MEDVKEHQMEEMGAEPTKTEEGPVESADVPVVKAKEKKNKVYYTYLFIGIFIGVFLSLIVVQSEIVPLWVTQDTMEDEIVFSNILTLMSHNGILCETMNVTMFEFNNPNEEPIADYNGNNISAKSINVNDACIIYNRNKEEQG